MLTILFFLQFDQHINRSTFQTLNLKSKPIIKIKSILNLKSCLFFLLLFLAFKTYPQNFIEQSDSLNLVGNYGSNNLGLSGGLSFSDFNKDGYDDLTFCTSSGKNLIFYENKISHFEAISIQGINNFHETKQSVWVDYDNDGDQDLFVTAFLNQNRLYENDGNFNFTDVTFLRGIAFANERSYGVNFFDYDLDGYLDIYISNYNFNFETVENELYIFNTNLSMYQNLSYLLNAGNGNQASFCSTAFDYNFDTYPDLYVANDRIEYENALLKNNGANGFIDASASSNSNISIFAMNSGVADYNNDGLWDIFITNEDNFSSVLLKGNANETFTDMTTTTQTSIEQLAWTGNFFDYDNDKDEDLYVSCTSYKNGKTNAFFKNTNFVFEEPLLNSFGLNSNDTLPGFCHAIGDFNNDGFSDIVLNNYGTHKFSFYLNHEKDNNNTNNFLKIKLEGVQSNRDAIGAVIKVWQSGNYRIFQKHCSNGFLNQNGSNLSIGVGTNEKVDSLEISWPFLNSFETIIIDEIPLNTTYFIKEGMGIIDQESLELCKTIHAIKINPVCSQIYGSTSQTICSSLIQDNADVVLKSMQEVILEKDFHCQANAN